MPALTCAHGLDVDLAAGLARSGRVRLLHGGGRGTPGAQLVVMPDAGHSAPWERPEDFNRAVLGFIGRVEAARA